MGHLLDGLGLLQLLIVAHVMKAVPISEPQPGFAVWFVPLAVFTFWGAVAAIRENLPLFVVLATVGVGSGCVSGGFWTGDVTWIKIGAWLFVIGACAAWYTGAMVLLEYSWNRVVLPLGVIPGLMKLPAAANVPGTPRRARRVRARTARHPTHTLTDERTI